MRRAIAVMITAMLAAMLVVGALAGCAQQNGGSSGSASASAADSGSSPAGGQGSNQFVGMPNPWSGASSATEAAQGAGLDGFSVMNDIQIGDVQYTAPTFSYMDGIVQARYESPATEVTLRKSSIYSGKEDLAGDYTNYAQSWTQDHDGLQISCYGESRDAAQLILWHIDGNSYSLGTLGLGGDAFGMTPDDVASLVSGIR